MTLLIVGASGFLGGEVLRQALASPDIARVRALTRRPLARSHDKLDVQLLPHFLDYSGVELGDCEACVWALGTARGSLTEQAYVEVTVGYAVAAARALFARTPQARFCFVSGRSADPEERARPLFARIKGRAERELNALDGQVYVFRPGYIQPTARSGSRKDAAQFFEPLGAVLAWLAPNLAVGCDQLAGCLLDVALHGAPDRLLLNRTIRAWSLPEHPRSGEVSSEVAGG